MFWQLKVNLSWEVIQIERLRYIVVSHLYPGRTFSVLRKIDIEKLHILFFFISGIALKEMCNGFEQFRYKLLSHADDKQNNSTIINFLQLFLREYCYRLSEISFTIQVQNTWNRRIKHFFFDWRLNFNNGTLYYYVLYYNQMQIMENHHYHCRLAQTNYFEKW